MPSLGYDYISKKHRGYGANKQFPFFIPKYPARNFHVETCQAIPSILSCFWPAFHPQNTTKVNVLWLSSPPPNLPHFCYTSESVELFQYRFEIGSKGTKYFSSQRCSIRLVPVIVSGFEQLTKMNTIQMTDPKTYSSDSCHCPSPTKLSCHAKIHSCNRFEIIITLLNGSNPWRGDKGLHRSIGPSIKHEGVKIPARRIWHSLILTKSK